MSCVYPLPTDQVSGHLTAVLFNLVQGQFGQLKFLNSLLLFKNQLQLKKVSVLNALKALILCFLINQSVYLRNTKYMSGPLFVTCLLLFS